MHGERVRSTMTKTHWCIVFMHLDDDYLDYVHIFYWQFIYYGHHIPTAKQ